MDKNYLEMLLDNLRPTQDSIKKTAEYCSSYPTVATEIAQMITDQFTQSRKDRKKFFLFLIHEIILDEKNRVKQKETEHPYIKAFGFKLKMLFTDFVQCNDDFQDLDHLQTIVKRWEKDQIYHPSFLDKLKVIIRPKYEQLKQQTEAFNHMNNKDATYQKLLQHNIKIIQENEQADRVFSYLQEQQKFDDELLKFSSEYDKFQEQTELNEDALEAMIQRATHFQNKFLEIIQKNINIQEDIGATVAPIQDEYNEFNIDDMEAIKDKLHIQ